GDLMPGDLCACGYETDPAAGYACSECDGSGDGYVGEVCRECDGSGWFVTPEQARAALAQPSPALPPFAEKVLAKLRRFYDCASDFESGGVDIGRHWFDLLTQLGLLNRVQRSPAFLEISQQGEDLLGMPQPSPAQAEQAEAERPEVVAYRTIGRHEKHQHPHYALNYYKQNAEDQAAHWRERGCEVSEDELMTVAQHDRIVGALRAEIAQLRQHKNDYMDAGQETYRALQNEIREREAEIARLDGLVSGRTAERDAALARVAELERGKVYVEARQCDECQHGGINDSATGVAACHECDWTGPEPEEDRCPGCQRENCMAAACPQCGARYVLVASEEIAAPVAQAQRSVPEEFSFEYRHPNGECHTVTVSREQVINEMPDFLFEALCSKFCNCEPVGETNVVECRCDEYAEEFKLLAAAPGKEGL
ncbi:septum formation initiator family protein, partial [Pseudomonas aeruginosa]|nr:septum formation initiator family protein [Pseudomonas aeruginosa]